MRDPIYVTQPTLPDLEEFISYLQEIWENKTLSNSGPFHRQLERNMAEFLGVPYISLFANGTLALMTALQSLQIVGEVITSPYSFVATAHSILWNNLKPVFVDIETEFGNLDPEKIEEYITPQTTCVLPVHVYGNPCKVEKIQEVAGKYGLKVIYDAAHCFGVKKQGRSICNFGDLSILSFHATKVFNTMEGGAIVCHDAAMKERIDQLKNFGFSGETELIALGINSKMNEMQAALGIVQLKHHYINTQKRKIISNAYRSALFDVKGISFLAEPPNVESNYAYFPIFVDELEYGMSRDSLYERLKKNNIFGRRYFYPLISEFPMYKGLESANPSNLPVAGKMAREVICLPIYPSLKVKTAIDIVGLIREYSG